MTSANLGMTNDRLTDLHKRLDEIISAASEKARFLLNPRTNARDRATLPAFLDTLEEVAEYNDILGALGLNYQPVEQSGVDLANTLRRYASAPANVLKEVPPSRYVETAYTRLYKLAHESGTDADRAALEIVRRALLLSPEVAG